MSESSEGKKGIFDFNVLVIIATVLLIPLNLAFCGLIKASWLIILLGVVGASGLPLWALVIAQGTYYNGSTIRYMLIMLAGAIMSAYPYFLCFGEKSFKAQSFFSLSFTAFVYLGSILLMDKFKVHAYKILTSVTVLLLMIFVIRSDWALALIPGYIVYLFKDKFIRLAYYMTSFSIVFLIVGIVMYMPQKGAGNTSEYLHMIAMSGSCLSLPLVRFYNEGPVRRPIRYTPYIIYPLILLGLFFLKGLL